jgi:hypothetical protein
VTGTFATNHHPREPGTSNHSPPRRIDSWLTRPDIDKIHHLKIITTTVSVRRASLLRAIV